MATFDALIDDLASRYGLGGNARSLIKEALTMIANSPGGLGGFLDTLKSAGLTSEVASWLGHADAAPIAAAQVERALGADCPRRDCGPSRPHAGRRVDRARIRLAEDRRPLDAGRRRSRRRARGGHGFSLATASRSGDGTGRAAAARRPSGERAERFRRPALAMAGARCVGRRWPAFLFLVDAQPDAVRSAGRKGAGAGDARALDRRAGAIPPPAPSPAAQAPSPPPSLDGSASAIPAAFAAAMRRRRKPPPPRACAFDGRATARACACSFDGSAGDGCSPGACSVRGSTSDSSAGFASAGGASARRPGFASVDRTGACNPGSCRSRNG